MLEGSYYDANIKERKAQVKSLELSSNKPDQPLLQFDGAYNQQAHADVHRIREVIEDAFQAKKVTLAVFIDLQKAFDKVWKYGLLVKLLRYGISGRMYNWTKTYL